MKKKLTEEEFARAVSRLSIGAQTRSIGWGVLVEGRPQMEYVKATGLSKGAVSQAVNRIWRSAESHVPEGMTRVTAVLPERQAYIVKRWAEDAKRSAKGSK